MPSHSQRQALRAISCSALVICVVYSLLKLSRHYTYNRHIRVDQANGPIKPASGNHADVLVGHARRGLDGLVPDPALSSLLASGVPTHLGITAASGPWIGGGRLPSATTTSPAAFAIKITVTTTTTFTRTMANPSAGYYTQPSTFPAGNVPAHNERDSDLLAANLGHVSPVPARPTTQPSAFGWSFAGCWADQPHQPVLAAFPAANLEAMTNEICIRHCFVNGYTLAATSSGKNCYCGQFLNGTQKLDSQCGTPCLGDATEICGGEWALSCYSPDGQARGWAPFGGEQPLPDVLDPPVVKRLAVGAVDFTVVTSLRSAFPTPGADPSSLLSRYGHVTQHPKATLPGGVGPSTACAGGGGSAAGPGQQQTSDDGAAVTVPGMASNPTVTLRPGALVSPQRNPGA